MMMILQITMNLFVMMTIVIPVMNVHQVAMIHQMMAGIMMVMVPVMQVILMMIMTVH